MQTIVKLGPQEREERKKTTPLAVCTISFANFGNNAINPAKNDRASSATIGM